MTKLTWVFATALAVLSSAAALAAPGNAGPDGRNVRVAAAKPADSAADAAARKYFTDLPVQTQTGETVRFYTDVLKDRVVLVNFVFSNCKDACPLLIHKMVQVKNALGDRQLDVEVRRLQPLSLVLRRAGTEPLLPTLVEALGLLASAQGERVPVTAGGV